MEKNNEKILPNGVSSTGNLPKAHSSLKNKNKIVETYAEDMVNVLENDKSGLIKKIIHEQEENEIEKKNLSPESTKNKVFMILGFLFVFLSVITLFYFVSTRKDNSVVLMERRFMSLIFHETSNFIEIKDLKKEEIVQVVSSKINETKVKKGGVEGVYLTNNKEFVGLREFIASIESSLVLGDPSLVDDNFLLGIVNNDKKDFFILLKVRSTEDIFSSLRAWENKMFFDLHGFFGKEISSETKDLLTANFEDGVIKNKNARILYDKERKIVMMYIFANDNSVIITNTEEVTEEIMLRLASGRLRK